MAEKESAADAKRRRLEEKMGGSSGGLGGFGAPVQWSAAPAAAAPAAKPVKKVEAGPQREEFIMSANEAVCFRLVQLESEMDAAQLFNPEFTHQIFREDETIFGFKELEINVYMHAVSFHTYIEICHKGTAPTQFGPPDNIEARLKENFPGGYTTSRDEFKKWLKDLGPSPSAPGSIKAELYSDASGVKVIQLDTTNASAKALHMRLAPFVLFEIDGGQLLNLEEDPDWEVLLCTCPTPSGGHVVSGFFTAYRFRTLPDVVRFRLSQLIVLFPYRRRGFASAMIAAMRALALKENAVDYTVEDPTDAFQRRRDISDVAAAREIPEIDRAVKAAVTEANTQAEEAKRIAAFAMPAAVGALLRDKLRLCRSQQRKEMKLEPKGSAAVAFQDWTTRRLQRSKGGDSEKKSVDGKLLFDKEKEFHQAGVRLAEPGFIMCRATNVKKPAAVREEENEEEASETLATALAEEFGRLIAIAAAVATASAAATAKPVVA